MSSLLIPNQEQGKKTIRIGQSQMYFESHHIFSTDVFSKNEYLRFKTSGYRSKRSTSCMLADFPSRALAAKV